MTKPGRILMIYTGGTIGMIQDKETGSLKPFQFDNLLLQIPELNHLNASIDTDSFDEPIDSSSINPTHWERLANRIHENYNYYDGFVILHGSDTMAYTASALSFMLSNVTKPIILTGSQLPIGIPRSDARENLLTSVEIALAKTRNGLAQVPEVSVYFEYNLYRGNRIHKISTQDFEAFQSLNYPFLATAGVDIQYAQEYISRRANGNLAVNTRMENTVGVLSCFPGMSPDFVSPVLQNEKLKVIIIRTFGSGNIPLVDWFLHELKAFSKRGGFLVNLSQCDGGGVFLGQYEGSQALLNIGVISAHDMTFEAAITKAMHLLPKKLAHADFKRLYESNLKGELTHQNDA